MKFVVRTKSTGDKIYLIEDNKRKWIRNPETLNLLGFKFGDEKTINFADLLKYEDDGYIDLSTKKSEIKHYVKNSFKKSGVLNYRKYA